MKFTALPSAIIKETAVDDVANDSDVVANSERVLEILRIDGSKSAQIIADELGISQRQVQRIISEFEKQRFDSTSWSR